MSNKKDKGKNEKEQSSGINFTAIWKWLYLIGGLGAAFTGGFSFYNETLDWVLLVVAVLVGLFYINSDDLTNFGVRYILLGTVAGMLGNVPSVGLFFTNFFLGFFNFLGPVALAALVMWFWRKQLANLLPQ